MRPTTSIWIGVNHVGIKERSPEVKQLTVAESVRWFAEQLRDNTLAQRIDFAIARTEAEVLQRLGERGNAKSTTIQELPDDFWANLEDELNNIPE